MPRGALALAVWVQLAAALRQTPARPAAAARCNASAKLGKHFLVDNSRLNANTRGLSYRVSKSSGARDPEAIALWGSEVVGLDDGDGWIRVGTCFLPMMLNGVPTLRPVVPEAALELSQRLAAKSYAEGQLKQALTEAAEVTEKMTARLKRSEAELHQLRGDLAQQRTDSRKQLDAAEAKNKELLRRLDTELNLSRANRSLEFLNMTYGDLEATNKNLSAQAEQLAKEKAFFRDQAEDLRQEFINKDKILRQTVLLLDQVQDKYRKFREEAATKLAAKESGAMPVHFPCWLSLTALPLLALLAASSEA